MRWIGLVLFGLLFISFVAAENSSETGTNLTIGGCNTPEGFGIAAGTCSRDPIEGEYFCDNDGVLLDTFEEGLGCAMGDSNYEGGGLSCCPENYFCNKTDDNRFICNQRLGNCSTWTTKTPCENNDCIWDDIGEECLQDPRIYPCSHYNTNASCTEDKWNLGQSGMGTEKCQRSILCDDEYYSVRDCSCAWYEYMPVGEKCRLDSTAIQSRQSVDSDAKSFNCSSSYTLGDCIEGIQDVKWFSTHSIISGVFEDNKIPVECLDAMGCSNGTGTRACGEPIIKLPGFSLFAFFMSLFIVGTYCVFRQEDLNKINDKC